MSTFDGDSNNLVSNLFILISSGICIISSESSQVAFSLQEKIAEKTIHKKKYLIFISMTCIYYFIIQTRFRGKYYKRGTSTMPKINLDEASAGIQGVLSN